MWRNFLVTSAVGELRPIGKREGKAPLSTDIDERRTAWEGNKTPSFAADLLNAAYVAGAEHEARVAAEFLLAASGPIAATTKSFATFVLSGRKRPVPILSNPSVDIKQSIHELKSRIRNDFRDAIAWLDLARLYTTLGARAQAQRAVSIATSLSPNNRFILRGAARFYVHKGEPDIAHRLLRRSLATPHDPWLLSTEVALAGLLKSAPKFYKHGVAFLESAPGPHHISELASGLGTLELGAGSTKKAKKLFTTSLVAPNSNALAQAGWAAQHLPGFQFDPSNTNIPFSFEAMSQHYMQEGNWDSALEQAENWLTDQVFSSRPAIRASYLSSTHKEDYKRGEAFARHGIRANPQDFTLRNNLVYALAKSGQILEAKAELAKIEVSGLRPFDKVVHLATSGLIYFVENNPMEARKLYRRAVEMAHELGDRRLAAMATLFWALEEHAHMSDEQSGAIISAAVEESRHLLAADDQKISSSLLARIKQSTRKS